MFRYSGIAGLTPLSHFRINFKCETVTIATNMAGRGTDIVLGGAINLHEFSDKDRAKAEADWEKQHEKVLQAGGLHIIGTERHESRRIDNQLRGRSGRDQGRVDLAFLAAGPAPGFRTAI